MAKIPSTNNKKHFCLIFLPIIFYFQIKNNVKFFNFRFFNLVGVIYLLIFFVGAIGNLIVLYGFSKNPKLRETVSNGYIWHLAITDFIFVCTLPFFAIDYFNRHVWIFGTFMCKLFRSVSKINMYR